MRNFIDLYVNDTRYKLSGHEVFWPLSDFLRYSQGLTGTKVVCAEGDCGACTVLAKNFLSQDSSYLAINSCIAFMWQLDGHHIITVEGLKRGKELHPAQKSMQECHGAQCGYCTPGFICSMAQLAEDSLSEGVKIEKKKAQNYLTGNLCRCTGYDSILEASQKMDLADLAQLANFYPESQHFFRPETVVIEEQGLKMFLPHTLKEAQSFMQEGPRLVSGATDLGVLYNKGKWAPQKVMSLKNITELYAIEEKADSFVVGARASLAATSKALGKSFPEFSRLLRIFASPQIKNSATLVGNMMNASPIADTIPFLKVAESKIHLLSTQGARVINVNDFFLPGYKKMDLRPDELVTHVEIPKTGKKFKLYKVSKRKDLDISAVTMAIAFELNQGVFSSFALALGGVAASVVRFPQVESSVLGHRPSSSLMEQVFLQIDQLITPQSDVRGEAGFRRLLVKNLLQKFVHELASEVRV
jgi:xanthine dehydrogenase small subunit